MVSPTGLDAQLLDPDAVRAIARLHSYDHEAYLVGGCVRDLLLGQRPKDFDIATSARPPSVKRTFPRNCRIIGRRFKLAHLHFDGNRKILEVSTFRRAPEQDQDDVDDEQDLLITRDNEFGTAEEDAVRRDFTINALFLDPTRDEIIDHVGGLADIEKRLLRTIGDPLVRFREDPVRILRAIKFAGRLDLSIESRTADAMCEVAPDLVRAAPPRVLEEILRLLRGGHAFDAVQRMRACGALKAILPTVDDFLAEAEREDRVGFWRALEALDGRARRAARGQTSWPPENGVMLGCLFERVIRAAAATQHHRSTSTLAEELIAPFAADFRLPKRDAGCVKRICAIQSRFLDPDPERRSRLDALLGDPYFEPALELFEIVSMADGRDLGLVELWRTRMRRDHTAPRPQPVREAAHGRERPRGDRPRPRSDAPPRAQSTPRASEARRKGPAPSKRDSKRTERNERAERNRKRDQKRDERVAKKREESVEAIEPTAVDVSAFDLELDPRRVPTFGTIVDAEQKRPKRGRAAPGTGDDNYRPPPPPTDELGPTAPPPPPGVERGPFGDW